MPLARAETVREPGPLLATTLRADWMNSSRLKCALRPIWNIHTRTYILIASKNNGQREVVGNSSHAPGMALSAGRRRTYGRREGLRAGLLRPSPYGPASGT